MSGKKRGRRSVMPWAVSIALLGVALWALLANVVFVVRDVQVVGAGNVPESEVVRLSGIRLGTRLGALDAEKVRVNVESDGRLAFVSLGTRLPGRAVLTVRPRTMDAVIFQGGKILVLDSDAYVVAIADRLPEGVIPYVTGLRGVGAYALGRQLDTADGRCGAMKAVVEALKEQGATRYVSELSVADVKDLRIITRTGITVLLGDGEDMRAKIAWMAGVLADLEARGESGGQLDVSSGNKADYRPAEASQEAEAAPEATAVPEATQAPEEQAQQALPFGS